MSPTTFGAILALAGAANAFWRMPCSGRLLLERADPIIDPGQVSGHVHTISGGNGFDFEMDYAKANSSTCSSCPIKKDLSNYWTPKLYYVAEDGTFEDVPQAGESEGRTGGMTVYYQQRGGPKDDKLHAFPNDFRMVAGDPFQRNQTGAEAAPGKAVSFVCLDYSGTSDQFDSIPDKNCPDGLRAQIYFPSCWDGVNGDSADHRSHMHYPIGQHDSGSCPESHPVHLISIFFEVIYSIDQFSKRWHGQGHPFVFAQGDRTGYGLRRLRERLEPRDAATSSRHVHIRQRHAGRLPRLRQRPFHPRRAASLPRAALHKREDHRNSRRPPRLQPPDLRPRVRAKTNGLRLHRLHRQARDLLHRHDEQELGLPGLRQRRHLGPHLDGRLHILRVNDGRDLCLFLRKQRPLSRRPRVRQRVLLRRRVQFGGPRSAERCSGRVRAALLGGRG